MHSVVLKNKLEIVTANPRPGQLFWILNHFVKVQHFSRTPRGTLVVSLATTCSSCEEENVLVNQSDHLDFKLLQKYFFRAPCRKFMVSLVT